MNYKKLRYFIEKNYLRSAGTPTSENKGLYFISESTITLFKYVYHIDNIYYVIRLYFDESGNFDKLYQRYEKDIRCSSPRVNHKEFWKEINEDKLRKSLDKLINS